MARSTGKWRCSNCQQRHRGCGGYDLSENNPQCAECRQQNIDCDIAVQSDETPAPKRRRVTRQNATLPPSTLPRPRTLAAPQEDTQLVKLRQGELKLVIGLDFGTENSAASVAIVPTGFGLQAGRPIPNTSIQFAGEKEVMMQVAILSSLAGNTMFVGKQVERMLCRGEIHQENVFLFPKLALLNGVEDQVLGAKENANTHIKQAHRRAEQIHQWQSRIFLRFIDQEIRIPLDSACYTFTLKSARDIIEGIAAWLWDKIVADIRDQNGWSNTDAAEVLKQAKVAAAVPEIWTDTMVDQFRLCLFKGGFPNINIVSEAKCAAIVIAHKRQSTLHQKYEYLPEAKAAEMAKTLSTIMIVFDLGAGTLSFT